MTNLTWESLKNHTPSTTNLNGHCIIFRDMYYIIDREGHILVNNTKEIGRIFQNPMANRNETIVEKLANSLTSPEDKWVIVKIPITIFLDDPGRY